MVPCHGAASRRSPAQLCGLPYGAVRLSDSALLLPDGSALPRRCHQALTCAALRLPYGAVRLPDSALPRRCHQALTSTALRASLWCRATALPSGTHQRSSASSVPQSQRCGIHFRAAVSGAAADMLLAKRTKMPILCSGRWEGGIGKRKSGLPANHRARFKNSNAL